MPNHTVRSDTHQNSYTQVAMLNLMSILHFFFFFFFFFDLDATIVAK